MAQLQDASLYVSERNMGDGAGHRLAARSTDMGRTFSSFERTALTEPVTANWVGIVGSVATMDGSLLYAGGGAESSP